MRPPIAKRGPVLSRVELAALVAVTDGEDILSSDMARCLRGIADKRPDLVVITTPKMPREADEPRAFFHAQATDKGRSYFFQRVEVRV